MQYVDPASSLVDCAGHAVHAPLMMYWFDVHVHDVTAPPALVDPPGHASHESPSQYWLAAQSTAVQVAVFVSVPPSHDLDPLRIYPSLHVGSHDVPSARELVQGAETPFGMSPEASQDGQAPRLRHDPSEDEQSVQH
mgnify:FL=1|jgi:hypothetical protein